MKQFFAQIFALALILEEALAVPKPCGSKKCEEKGFSRPCHSYFDCRFKPEGSLEGVYFKCDGSRCLCELFGFTRDEFGEVTTMWDKTNQQCIIGQRGSCGSDNGIEIRCELGYECVNTKCEKRPDLENLTGCKNKNGCEFGKETPPCADPDGCEYGRMPSSGREGNAEVPDCEESGSCEKSQPEMQAEGWGARGRPVKQKGCQSGSCGSKKPKCGEGSSGGCNRPMPPMRPTKKPCGEEGSPCGGTKKPNPCGNSDPSCGQKPMRPTSTPCQEKGACGRERPMRPTSSPCEEKGGCGQKPKGGCGSSGGCGGGGSRGGSGGGGSRGGSGGGSGAGFAFMKPRTTPMPRLPCGPENGCEEQEEKKKSPCGDSGCSERETAEEAEDASCGKEGGCGKGKESEIPLPDPKPQPEEPPCKKDNSCESDNDSKGSCDKCSLFNFYRYTKDK